VPQPPSSIVGLPDLSLVGNVSFGAFGRVDALTVRLLPFTLSWPTSSMPWAP
jgi:AGZA family xanthine/uracil permease-like MFS transporter